MIRPKGTPIARTNPITVRSDDQPDKIELFVAWPTCVGLIPDDFDTDGATIPRLLWWLVGHPLTPCFQGAAILHDWLYRLHSVTRAEADALFRDKLSEDGAGWLRSRAMWAAVRAFGWLYW